MCKVKVDFEDVVGQDSLTRFDKPKTSNYKRNKKKKRPVGALANNLQQKPKTKRKLQGQQQNKLKHQDNPQAQQQNSPMPRSKPNVNASTNQPTGEVKKQNKPKRNNNRNRNNNTPKNGNDSEK